MPLCKLTRKIFEMSELERKLRTDLDAPEPDLLPHLRIRHLGAFWPHWSLHKRKCDKTGREIISVFRPDCPYPVWHKDEWYKHANPPKGIFDFSQPFFTQAEQLFKECPIAHHTGENNDNCEYTDDAWHCKNCYLAHSLFKTEDCRYTYRAYMEKDSLYNAFSYSLERCMDCVNCNTCHSCIHCLETKNCQSCAFCFDCRNCRDCLFCFNLRNKQYCIGNVEYTREKYLLQKQQFEYATLMGYQKCQQFFKKILQEKAYFRAQHIDTSDNAHGNYIQETRNVENAFYMNKVEDLVNVSRGTMAKTCVDCISPYDTERQYMCSAVQLTCYDVRFSFQLTEARFVDYSAYSAQLENCFGCCGLVRGKNCIFNTPYSVQEYTTLRQKIIDHMRSTGEWGRFFPGSFAPNPYDESWSSFYFPLSENAQHDLGFFYLPNPEKHNTSYLRVNQLPLTAKVATEETTKQTYWDDVAKKPFQILPQDINLCRELEVCLPYTHYMRRVQENFRWMPYDGTLRKTTCAKSGVEIGTSWPPEYDGRILSEKEYNAVIN